MARTTWSTSLALAAGGAVLVTRLISASAEWRPPSLGAPPLVEGLQQHLDDEAPPDGDARARDPREGPEASSRAR
jgi:hypothetical protein